MSVGFFPCLPLLGSLKYEPPNAELLDATQKRLAW